MNEPNVLNTLRLPGRLDRASAAKLLGVAEHDLAVLEKRGLVPSLGRPAPNAPRYYASAVIESLARDPQAMDKITRVLTEHWSRKNQRRQRVGVSAN